MLALLCVVALIGSSYGRTDAIDFEEWASDNELDQLVGNMNLEEQQKPYLVAIVLQTMSNCLNEASDEPTEFEQNMMIEVENDLVAADAVQTNARLSANQDVEMAINADQMESLNTNAKLEANKGVEQAISSDEMDSLNTNARLEANADVEQALNSADDEAVQTNARFVSSQEVLDAISGSEDIHTDAKLVADKEVQMQIDQNIAAVRAQVADSHVEEQAAELNEAAEPLDDTAVEPNSANGDPHFMMTSPLSRERLCFDANGGDGDVMKLIDDPATDLFVNGQLFATGLDHGGNRLTFFSHMAVIVGGLDIVCSLDDVTIDDDIYDWGSINEQYDHVVIESAVENSVQISLPNDIIIEVTKSFGKAANGPYLGVFVLRSTGLSDNATGIMGQFFHTEFSLTEPVSYAKDETTSLQFNDEHGLLPVKSVQRFNGILRELVQCWLYVPGTENQLLGPRESYIIDHDE